MSLVRQLPGGPVAPCRLSGNFWRLCSTLQGIASADEGGLATLVALSAAPEVRVCWWRGSVLSPWAWCF
jgi:hypothetical protein